MGKFQTVHRMDGGTESTLEILVMSIYFLFQVHDKHAQENLKKELRMCFPFHKDVKQLRSFNDTVTS